MARGAKAEKQHGGNGLYQVKVLDKIVKILDCFSDAEPRLKLMEIAKRTGLGKSTAHRLLMVMQAHQMIGYDAPAAEYYPGMKLIAWGSCALNQIELRKLARPALERLVEEVQETALLGILDEQAVVYLDRVESRHPLRTAPTVGRRYPVHAVSGGKCILAFQPAAKASECLKGRSLTRFTPKTITSPAELKKHLETIRRNGYAVSNQEMIEGICSVAAPIFDHRGEVIGSISISGPVLRVTKERIPALAQKVVAAAQEISRQLGYRLAANQ
jgi:DNA-binding IclR family transcriptional regulator